MLNSALQKLKMIWIRIFYNNIQIMGGNIFEIRNKKRASGYFINNIVL